MIRRRNLRLDYTPEQHAAENALAARLAAAWRCEVHRFGHLDAIDGWALRNGHLQAFIEMKARTCTHDTYETVRVSLRKIEALIRWSTALGVEGIYVSGYTDGVVLFINVLAIDCSKHVIAGNSRRQLPNDIEIMIDIPRASMHVLKERTQGRGGAALSHA